jgi:DNA-binding response OmpR family regulator
MSDERPLRVLVVDDDPGLADLLGTVLEEAGMDTAVVHSAQDALDYLWENKRDALLVDRDMPGGMDGLELIEKLRNDGFDRSILMITGVGTVRTATKAMELGVSAFLAKPFADIFEVVETVRRLVTRDRERRHRKARASRDPSGETSLQDVADRLRLMRERMAQNAAGEVPPFFACVLADDDAEDAALREGLVETGFEIVERTWDEVGVVADPPVDVFVIGAPLADLRDRVESLRFVDDEALVICASTAPDMELVAKLIGQGVVAFVDDPSDGVLLRAKLAMVYRRLRETLV